jgi:rod shape-determining protein MreC
LSALSTTRQNVIILALLLFAQLVLMSASARGADGSTMLESWAMRISSPVIGVARIIGGGFDAIGSAAANLLHAHSRNAALRAEVARLRDEVRRSREEALENDRLRTLLGMRQDLAPHSIAANVIHSALTEPTRLLVVDRGTRDGVVLDAPVVAWGGAVGRVVMAGAGVSKVQLLTDPNSGVGGVVQRSRVPGIVLGKGADRLEMLYGPRFADVQTGDRVVTSGQDGIFPRGFGIGRVARIERGTDGSQVFELVVELDLETLEEVLILPGPIEPDPATASPVEEER